ncbi:hypothetical protein ACVIGA_004644 [Bradyrhizobium sp. USDA 3240]
MSIDHFDAGTSDKSTNSGKTTLLTLNDLDGRTLGTHPAGAVLSDTL